MEANVALIGAGLCSIGLGGAAIAIGNIFGSYFNSVARNPSVAKNLEKFLYIGFALAEATGLFAFVLAIMIMNK